jgi:hypothetical protein
MKLVYRTTSSCYQKRPASDPIQERNETEQNGLVVVDLVNLDTPKHSANS